MHVSRVKFENFRNFKSLDVSLNQGFVVLIGANGSGKTNFLEGIHFGCSLRRFPETKFRQLVFLKENYFRVVIWASAEEIHEHDFFAENKDGKFVYQLKMNNQKVSRGKYSGHVPVISFLPQDLNLLSRSPGGRRRFLNETLVNIFPQYRAALESYEKALQQRNQLLQSPNNSDRELEIWDEQLAEFGSTVVIRRKKFIEFLNESMDSALEKLSPELLSSKIEYISSGTEDKGVFLKKFLEAREKDVKLGTTSIGPHRDDFFVIQGDVELVGFASRGQMRGLTLVLKVLERKYIEQNLGIPPILLLDDVFSELDTNHQQKLISFFDDLEQVFITTTHLSDLKGILPKNTQIFNVGFGEVKKADV